jgi:predicted ArsR family transcriptional regulator
MEESSTKQKILTHLKKSDHLTVAELSRRMGITPMAVRQHLMTLEKKGIIQYEAKKYGVGRPVFLYSLTERAEGIFPKAYGTFLTDMLRTLEEMDGKRKLDKLFRLRKEHLLAEKRKSLSGLGTLPEKLSKLAEELEADGFMAELSQDKDNFILKQFNCPIKGVSSEFTQPCKYELELYRDLLGTGVSRPECQREGDPACVYLIPKAQPLPVQ